jgi:signal transduction histidine kinase
LSTAFSGPASAGRFSYLILALRWATVATGAVLTLARLPSDPGLVAATTALLANALWRTLRPLPRPGESWVATSDLLLDLGLGVGAVAASGGWGSPYVFTLLVGVLLAGFSRGYAGGLAAALLCASGLAAVALAVPSARASGAYASQVALVYGATGVVAGYARRLFLEFQEGQRTLTDRMAGLFEANALLSELTRVARTLPSSLDLPETLSSAQARLGEVFDFTSAALLICDPATATWTLGTAVGVRPTAPLPDEGLPPSLRQAVAVRAVVTEEDLAASRLQGLAPLSRSGLYAPLVARGRLVALVAIEHEEPGRYGWREVELLEGLSDPLALAIDNALWFGRLRALGADSERSRIARELHDRLGQGLAYVGMELERLAKTSDPGPELVRLREDVRSLLGDVRETLRQLRAEVSETRPLTDLAQDHLSRLSERTGMDARFEDRTGGRRLPLPVEQELWRILQEALSNVERHSGAAGVVVSWAISADGGRLQVRDDGKGLPPDGLAGAGGVGMTAMRERANAVGARLTVASPPGGGTDLIVTVEGSA